eukprot:10772163-Ditylum_brightwellii.AAC.1
MNDIAIAYVVAVSLHKTEYKRTTNSATHNTEGISTLANLTSTTAEANETTNDVLSNTRSTCAQLPSLSQTPYTQDDEDYVDSKCLLLEVPPYDAESEQEAEWTDGINPSEFRNAV